MDWWTLLAQIRAEFVPHSVLTLHHTRAFDNQQSSYSLAKAPFLSAIAAYPFETTRQNNDILNFGLSNFITKMQGKKCNNNT